MRKFLIVLAFAGVSMASMAQDTTPTEKYSVATNSFWSNWFIQVGGEWNAFYSNQEHAEKMGLDGSPLKGFRSSPGAAIAIGKWFTPGLGLRTKVQGIWGRTVQGDNKDDNENKYWTANEQVLFNLSNMLCGYNPDRVWNFIPFAGAGVSRSMTHDTYGMDFSVGILNQFYVSKKVAINLEFGWIMGEQNFDGVGQTGFVDVKNRYWDSHDNNIYAELGLTFNLGKATWDKTPDVDAIKALSQAQIDALNAQLNDANAENARLRDLLANQPKVVEQVTPECVTELITTPISVFFDLNKVNVANPKDIVNVSALAKFAVTNDSKILVTGFADSATGTKAINDDLSVRRANTVADELVKLGVNRDNITTKADGGVDTLSPIEFNRRATVQITDPAIKK